MAKTKPETGSSGRTEKIVKYPLWKYVETEGIRIERYMYAYLTSVYRGKMNTKKGWEEILKSELGDKT